MNYTFLYYIQKLKRPTRSGVSECERSKARGAQKPINKSNARIKNLAFSLKQTTSAGRLLGADICRLAH